MKNVNSIKLIATAGLMTCLSVLVGCSAGTGSAGGAEGGAAGSGDSGFSISGEVSAVWEKTSFVSTAHAGEGANPLAALSEMCSSDCSGNECAHLMANDNNGQSSKICSADVTNGVFNIKMSDEAAAAIAALQEDYIFTVEASVLNDDGVLVTKSNAIEVSEGSVSTSINDSTSAESALLTTMFQGSTPAAAKQSAQELLANHSVGDILVAISEALGGEGASAEDALSGAVKLGLMKTLMQTVASSFVNLGENFNTQALKDTVANSAAILSAVSNATNEYKNQISVKNDSDSGSSDSDSSSSTDPKTECTAANGCIKADPVAAAGFSHEKSMQADGSTLVNYTKNGMTPMTCSYSWNTETMVSSGSCTVQNESATNSCSFSSDDGSNGISQMACLAESYALIGIDNTQILASIQMMQSMNNGGGK